MVSLWLKTIQDFHDEITSDNNLTYLSSSSWRRGKMMATNCQKLQKLYTVSPNLIRKLISGMWECKCNTHKYKQSSHWKYFPHLSWINSWEFHSCYTHTIQGKFHQDHPHKSFNRSLKRVKICNNFFHYDLDQTSRNSALASRPGTDSCELKINAAQAGRARDQHRQRRHGEKAGTAQCWPLPPPVLAFSPQKS